MRRKRGGTEAERSERLSLLQENGEENDLAIASMLRIRKEGFQKVHAKASIHPPLLCDAALCIPGGTEEVLQSPENESHLLAVPASMHAFHFSWPFQTMASGSLHILWLTEAAAVPEAPEPGAAGGRDRSLL